MVKSFFNDIGLGKSQGKCLKFYSVQTLKFSFNYISNKSRTTKIIKTWVKMKNRSHDA